MILEAFILIAGTFVFTMLGLALHEIARASSYRFIGVLARTTLTSTVIPDHESTLWAPSLTGLAFRLALGFLGCFIASRAVHLNVALFGLTMAFGQLSVRPVIHLAMLFGQIKYPLHHDEIQLADAWHAPRVFMIAFVFVVFVYGLALTVGLALRFGLPNWAILMAFFMTFGATAAMLWLDRRLFGASEKLI